MNWREPACIHVLHINKKKPCCVHSPSKRPKINKCRGMPARSWSFNSVALPRTPNTIAFLASSASCSFARDELNLVAPCPDHTVNNINQQHQLHPVRITKSTTSNEKQSPFVFRLHSNRPSYPPFRVRSIPRYYR